MDLNRLHLHRRHINVRHIVEIKILNEFRRRFDKVWVFLHELLRLVHLLVDGFDYLGALFIFWHEKVDRGEDNIDHAFQRFIFQATVETLNGAFSFVLKEVITNLL